MQGRYNSAPPFRRIVTPFRRIVPPAGRFRMVSPKYNINMTQQEKVRTRIAPSPTGEDLHIGNLYTALINWAFAKKNRGKFIIRIEDTDRERWVEGAEERIFNTLNNFRLDHDEGVDKGGPFGPYRQSERLAIYKKYALELIEKGAAYYCVCTKERLKELRDLQLKNKKQTKYDKLCLKIKDQVMAEVEKGASYVIRLNVVPGKKILFKDLIRGEICISSDEVDDQVLTKSDGYPTYHLGVVVDDHLMEITHVIRAEEWISSTPKHVLLYESFGWDLPVFAHGPILRNPDRSKLSKRKNPVWSSWYLEEGYLPEAVLNYLALMGWSHPEEKEIFSLDEFIEVFELKDLKPVGPSFDLTKLTWMNQQYIQGKTDAELKKLILNFYPKAKVLPDKMLDALIPLLKTRMETLKDFEKLTDYFFTPPKIDIKDDKEKKVINDLLTSIQNIEKWDKESILDMFRTVMKTNDIRMPILYYICTGRKIGLPLPESLEILGRGETLARLKDLTPALLPQGH